MNSKIMEIVRETNTREAKINLLTELEEDINKAKLILSGKYKYCPECDDIYLSKSFFNEERMVSAVADVHPCAGDMIPPHTLSIGVKAVFRVCPKGHQERLS